jgi:NADP-dependent 3-hydroxy acid dehydrogenase YdfG
VILISGASSGIGEACALYFAAKGHELILGARRIERLKSLRECCQQLGSPEVTISQLDVSDQRSCEAFRDSTPSHVDVMILNAGLALGTDHVAAGNADDWQTVIDTNIMGSLRLARLYLPRMIENQRGHLVFMSSIAAHQIYEGGAVYAATKHAVRAIAQTLKLELNGKGIRVSTIDPGMVETEFSMVRFGQDKIRADKVYQGMTPLTPKDIAETIGFVVGAPAHVNIDQILLTPTDQASVHKVHRRTF